MKILRYPKREDWKQLLARPTRKSDDLNATVKAVLDDVRQRGDEAVVEYEERFDHVRLSTLAVTDNEMQEAEVLVSDDLKAAIQLAHNNIFRFHEAQRFEGKPLEVCDGVTCWQRAIAIERVGLYIPGGTAPLFSTVLMLAVPAKIAGCKDIVLCTPPSSNGKVHPAILVAARMAGVNRIFKIGGVQAIGAMAYGTQTVPKVFKIFGPGNQFVMCAKQHVSVADVAIDMPAGPSEVAVIADATSNPAFVAADLLSQAEHGADSQVLLLTTCQNIIPLVVKEIERQLAKLTRKEIAMMSLEHSKLILLHNDDEVMAMSNLYAPEHLIIETDNYAELAERVVNAGSVFLGHLTPESAGDYASGTNHTLPTNGYAVAYSGVNLDSYMRKVTFQHITQRGLNSIGRTVELMAEAEQLTAHRNAMAIRREQREESRE